MKNSYVRAKRFCDHKLGMTGHFDDQTINKLIKDTNN